MAEIEKSFAFLHESIPSWCKTLTEVEEKIMYMQNELAKMPTSTSSPLKRKKTGSVESIRDLDAVFQQPSRSADEPQPRTPTLKRKPASLASGPISSPPRYRSRTMMIHVHYDGQIQKQFESLVRSIGTGRNFLRKGKMAARAQALADLESSDDDESEQDEIDDIKAKIQFRRRNGLSSMRLPPSTRDSKKATPNPTTTPESMFDPVDKKLEQAQALCERAAHQSLREGDCRKELEGMQKYFTEVLETATQEVAKHNARKEEEAKTKSEAPLPTAIPTLTPQTARIRLEMKRPAPVIKAVPAAPLMSMDMGIEIDDDDDDDMDFIMPPVRLTSRA